MMNQLKQSFFQVFTVTTLWVTLLLTLFFRDQPIHMAYLWNVAGISLIAAVLFGVMYSTLWNHLTLKPDGISSFLLPVILLVAWLLFGCFPERCLS